MSSSTVRPVAWVMGSRWGSGPAQTRSSLPFCPPPTLPSLESLDERLGPAMARHQICWEAVLRGSRFPLAPGLQFIKRRPHGEPRLWCSLVVRGSRSSAGSESGSGVCACRCTSCSSLPNRCTLVAYCRLPASSRKMTPLICPSSWSARQVLLTSSELLLTGCSRRRLELTHEWFFMAEIPIFHQPGAGS